MSTYTKKFIKSIKATAYNHPAGYRAGVKKGISILQDILLLDGVSKEEIASIKPSIPDKSLPFLLDAVDKVKSKTHTNNSN